MKYSLLFNLLFLLSFAGFQECLPASIYGLEYNEDDFIVAKPTCVHRLPLLAVNRRATKGIRSFTVLNDSKLTDSLNADPSSRKHGEAFGFHEDDSIARGTWRAGNVGDTRAAVTPFLAHKHYGDSYKWMLYGDDDTLFYMTGVLKLLSQFDPEQPLAITDNIWYFSQHPSPHAPRCLPCGFNMSTITTNHSFTPRPACPFCTRALACGTYGARYHCNSTHLSDLRTGFSPRLLTFPLGGGGGGGADAHSSSTEEDKEDAEGEDSRERFTEGMREAGSRYSAWMSRHAELKDKYPRDFKYKPAMDWEMRDPPDAAVQAAAAGEADSDPQTFYGGRRRRSVERRRARTLLGEGRGDEEDGEADEVEEGEEGEEEHLAGEKPHEGEGDQWRAWLGQRQRRTLSGKSRPALQRYIDGTPWLSAALGLDLSRADNGDEAAAAAREALRLPHPFCARHDKRLHTRPAQSCLVSISGHGGTGILFSVGLMRLIEPEEAIRFITKQTGCGGGDCLLGRALWFRMGIGYTDPGSALQNGAERYERFTHFIDSNTQMPSLITLADPTVAMLNRRRGTATRPACDRACVWLIENVVGTHVRAQGKQVNNTVAAMLKHLDTHAQVYKWIREARGDPQVQTGNTTIVHWIQGRYGQATKA